MSKFAEKTKVSSDKSRSEIEKTLMRYGATGFAYGWQGSAAMIAFEIGGKHIQFLLPLPPKDSKEFIHTPDRGIRRTAEAAHTSWEQAVRQKWRALALAIKAKLECVDSGITTLEQEFLAHIMLPNGQTVGQWAMPRLEEVYSSGKMPLLLPSGRT